MLSPMSHQSTGTNMEIAQDAQKRPARRQRCATRVRSSTRTSSFSRLRYFVGAAFMLGLFSITLSGRTLSTSPASFSSGGVMFVEAGKSTSSSKPKPKKPTSSSSSSNEPVLLSDISEMRPKEIKRQLARKYGYSAETLAQMINKKDLVESLAYELHKDDEIKSKKRKSENLRKTIMVTLAVIVLFTFWPLIQKVIEIFQVNFVVYTGE
jgi:hypothetical protein